jgi:Tol biopolymer transport system component
MNQVKILTTFLLVLSLFAVVFFLIYLQFFSSKPEILTSLSQEELTQKAKTYIEKEKPDSALKVLSFALKKNPDQPETYYLLARMYYQDHSFTLAEEYCLKALELDYPQASELMTDIRFQQGLEDWQVKDKNRSLKNFLYVLKNSSDKEKIEKVAELTGGKYKLRQLTHDIFPDYAPCFSRDGKRIIFFSDTSYLSEDFGWGKNIKRKSQIYQIDVSGEKKICLTHDDSSVQFPGISSDGKKIVYEKENPNTETQDLVFNYDRDLYIKRLDDGKEIRLTQNNWYDGQANFSPDDNKIVYVSGFSIKIMDLKTRKITNLDQPEGIIIKREKPVNQYYPSFSPDGKEILFQAGFQKRKIYLMDSDGKNLRDLSGIEDEDYYPSFSPDGQMIVFVSERTFAEELYLMDRNGKNQIRLTFDGMDKKHPCFSPDGKNIAYVAKEEEKPDPYFEIYILSLDEIIPEEKLLGRIENMLKEKD